MVAFHIFIVVGNCRLLNQGNSSLTVVLEWQHDSYNDRVHNPLGVSSWPAAQRQLVGKKEQYQKALQ